MNEKAKMYFFQEGASGKVCDHSCNHGDLNPGALNGQWILSPTCRICSTMKNLINGNVNVFNRDEAGLFT